MATRSGTAAKQASAFGSSGVKAAIKELESEIQELYQYDDVPWIIGYSGGKDSTATLQLIWSAVAGLPTSRRTKPIHVISTDTLVENPIVAAWVSRSLSVMKGAAENQEIPVQPHRLTPRVADSFWVNLIGKGYPAPRHKFRWCTERLKINPSNAFINGVVSRNGEAILVLGTRKSESSKRASVMSKHEKWRHRERLSPNAGLPGTLIYSPIESWTNDEVWLYLMQYANPWGFNNRDLLGMYAGASADGECPLVVDTSTPSCGDSRFGCWVCTLVEQDKSMAAMIQNDEEKEWMMPLLELRNALDFRPPDARDRLQDNTDRHLRDFRRMNGTVQLMGDGRVIPGPYKQSARIDWLCRLLEAQKHIQEHAPEDVRDLELISLEELQEIRRIWVIDKHEIEDALPSIYSKALGKEYPARHLSDALTNLDIEMEELRRLCGDDRLHYELARELISLTSQQQATSKRADMFSQLERVFGKHFFDSEEDAIARATKISRLRQGAKASGKLLEELTPPSLFDEPGDHVVQAEIDGLVDLK